MKKLGLRPFRALEFIKTDEDLTALLDDYVEESLQAAHARIFDLLLGDDGQAYKEAQRYLEREAPELYAKLEAATQGVTDCALNLCNTAGPHDSGCYLVDASAQHAAVRRVLQHHNLTKHGDAVVEADLIAALAAVKPAPTLTQGAAIAAEPWDAVGDPTLEKAEAFLMERNGYAAFFPVDANNLANIGMHLIREVRSLRASHGQAPAQADQDDPCLGFVPHTCAGFRGAFYSKYQRQPVDQEVWNAAIRSYRDLTTSPQAAQQAPAGAMPYGYVYTVRDAWTVGDERKSDRDFFSRTKPTCAHIELYTKEQVAPAAPSTPASPTIEGESNV